MWSSLTNWLARGNQDKNHFCRRDFPEVGAAYSHKAMMPQFQEGEIFIRRCTQVYGGYIDCLTDVIHAQGPAARPVPVKVGILELLSLIQELSPANHCGVFNVVLP